MCTVVSLGIPIHSLLLATERTAVQPWGPGRVFGPDSDNIPKRVGSLLNDYRKGRHSPNPTHKMFQWLGELNAPFAWGRGSSVVEGLLSLAGPQHWLGPRCRQDSEEENRIL